MIFYVLTLLVSIVFYSIIFQSGSDHISTAGTLCGPFSSGTVPIDIILDYLEGFSMYLIANDLPRQ